MPRPRHGSPSIPRRKNKNRRVWPGGGGLAFPTDPQANPRAAPAHWSPDIAPDVVILETPRPDNPPPHGCESLAEAVVGADSHLVLAHGPARLRLCVRPAPFRQAPAFAIPCDASCALRLAAATRLERVTRGGRIGPDRSGHPTTNHRRRLAQFLGIHDALEAGASTHELAFGLVFPHHSPLAGPIWKGSGERRHVLRLIAAARRLVTDGYRGLLLHR